MNCETEKSYDTLGKTEKHFFLGNIPGSQKSINSGLRSLKDEFKAYVQSEPCRVNKSAAFG